MLKINKKVEYALMALKFLQNHPSALYSAREISTRLTIPFDPTAKVLQILTNEGIVHAEQGVAGGYMLNVPLSSISLLNLMNSLENLSDDENICETKNKTCELIESCTIKGPISSLKKHIINFTNQLTLEDILK